MHIRTVLKITGLVLAAWAALSPSAASAQDAYPSKNIRFVVPYPPGGPTDLMARLLQTELQTRLGVSVIIDNKGGAGGNIGSADGAKQAPAQRERARRQPLTAPAMARRSIWPARFSTPRWIPISRIFPTAAQARR